jgi:simple sugar transport system ATP-binding protein
MIDKLVEMKHVNKHYGGVHALKNIDFDINAGEVHCLVGQNGCGKSTLIKIISGVVKSDEGSQITIAGKTMHHASSQFSKENGVKVIYQDFSLFPNLSIAENIAYDYITSKNFGVIDWQEIKKIAINALDLINVSFDIGKQVSELSIADRQLVEIARALATNAKLIIMDEPTSSLTRKEVDVLFSIIKNLQKEKGITILFVSHKLDEIVEIAERITVLRDGVKIATIVNVGIDEQKLSEMISGQSITYNQNFKKPQDSAILEVRNLSCGRQYKDISFTLNKGEILGIIGLLGSGRTELALSIFGMNKPDKGEIIIEGKQVYLNNNRDAINSGIAYVPEDRLLEGVVIDQSVESNISISVINKLKNKYGLINTNKRRNLTKKWIEKLNIATATPEINVSAMSGGNQQKIVISKWLSTEPKILILDQPTNGIDIAAKSAIYKIIEELAHEGMSIILISDEIPEIYYNCSRTLLMNKGRIIKEIDCSNISEEDLHKEVFYV